MDDILLGMKDIDRRTYDTFMAIAAFKSFWKETERLISDAVRAEETLQGPKWTPETDEEISEYLAERGLARHLHDEIVTPTFRYSATVTLFATFEREIKRFADNLTKERAAKIGYKDLKGGILEQVGKYTEAFYGFSIFDLPGYQGICLLQKVRDCIVHCYGEPSLSRDKKYLLSLAHKSKGLAVYDGIPIDISPLFIEQSLIEITNLFANMFLKAGWKIDNKWLAVPSC
jgi:hypothetical protein